MAKAKGKMSMLAAAEQVLTDAGGPLKADEIVKRAIDGNLIKTAGKTPEATMAAQLAVASKKDDPTFKRTDRGTYGLAGRDRKGAKSVAAAA